MKQATFRNMDSKIVTVKIGDYVSFKSDVEQAGKIIEIRSMGGGDYVFTLVNPNGFEGGYIGGCETTDVYSNDTWSEEDGLY